MPRWSRVRRRWARCSTGCGRPGCGPTSGGRTSSTAARFYQIYECADGEYVTVGAYEPAFYAELLRLTGLADDPDLPDQNSRFRWPEMTRRLAAIFRRRTRPEWCALLEGTDACFAPVLTRADAPEHPHNRHRGTFFVEHGVIEHGVTQPAPAPRLSATPAAVQGPPPRPGQHTAEILTEWLALADDEIAKLRETGAVVQSRP